MDREQRISEMARFFPSTKPGHGKVRRTMNKTRPDSQEYTRDHRFCLRGCEPTENGLRAHRQNPGTLAERFVDTGSIERPVRHKQDIRSEGDLSGEHRGFKEQGVIQTFTVGDTIQIEVPFLALKHGALKERENSVLNGSIRKVLPEPHFASRFERLVTVGIGGDKTMGVPAVWCHLVKPVVS